MRSPAFRMLMVGQSVSNIGNNVFMIAFPWLLLSRHGGVELLGTVLTCSGVARTAAIPLGGWLADRFGSWRVMLWSDGAQIAIATALALCAFLLTPSVTWVLPVDVCAAVAGGLLIPSSMSVIPALLPEDQVGRGVALFTGGLQLAGVVGPALGGAMVALLGAPSALVIDAGSYVVSTASLLRIRKFMATAATADSEPESAEAAEAADAPATGPADLPFGVFIRNARLLQALVLVSVVFYLAYPGMEQVAMPTLAHQDFGASGFGLLLTVQALCSLAGTALAGRYAQIRAVPYVQAILVATFGAALALVPYAGGLAGALVAIAVFSVAVGWQGIGMVTLLQTWTPAHLLGRTMSVLMAVSQGLSSISVAIITVIVHHSGPGPAFLIAGLASVATALGLLAFPAFRRYRLGDKFVLQGWIPAKSGASR